MKFYVLTLFPEIILSGLNHSIIKRGMDSGAIELECVNIRDFSGDKHNRVDDYTYGGGCGMLLRPQPVYDAYKSINAKPGTKVVYMTPHGRRFDQNEAEKLAGGEGDLILLCGHYEGIDQRVIDEIVTDEISAGDYILTGGELPAMLIIDAVSRLIPGVLGSGESSLDESFSGLHGLLEYPQYTRPYEFLGKTVPDILLSGHHKNIDIWRHEQSVRITKEKRPDLLKPKGDNYMKGIITVVGKDQVGIIAKVCTYLSNEGINILDISQTIVQGYFNMLMIVDVTGKSIDLDGLEALGGQIGVSIKYQHEDIFNSMHRI